MTEEELPLAAPMVRGSADQFSPDQARERVAAWKSRRYGEDEEPGWQSAAQQGDGASDALRTAPSAPAPRPAELLPGSPGGAALSIRDRSSPHEREKHHAQAPHPDHHRLVPARPGAADNRPGVW